MFQNFPVISDLLSEVSKFQHHTRSHSKCCPPLAASLKCSLLLLKRDISIFNTAFATTIVDLISRTHVRLLLLLLLRYQGRIKIMKLNFMWGTRWRSWFRHYPTTLKVAESIPDCVIGIFHWHNPSGLNMALGLTQPLTEMSTRNISWVVKAAGAYGWQPYHLHVPIVMKSGSQNLLEPSGLSRPVMGLLYLTF